MNDSDDQLNETPTHSPTIRRTFHVARRDRGAKELRGGAAPEAVIPGRLPRIVRLMALAIHFDQALASGRLRSQADLARAGQVTRARLSQIMNLCLLAPDLQEELLFMKPYFSGRAPITERQVRSIAAEPNWDKQRRRFKKLTGSTGRNDRG